MNKTTIQHVYKIYPEKVLAGYEDAFLQVEWLAAGLISMKTTTPVSEEYFGKVDIVLESQVAEALAKVFMELAREDNK